MNIIRRKPLSLLYHQNNPFHSIFGFDPHQWMERSGMPESESAIRWCPSVDIEEQKTSFLITAELPGMGEKDFEVKLEENRLVIRGEKKAENKKTDEGYNRVERSFGRFERTFLLSDNVDPTKISAVFKNGVLTVDIPKSAEAEKSSRTIEVKAA